MHMPVSTADKNDVIAERRREMPSDHRRPNLSMPQIESRSAGSSRAAEIVKVV